MAYTYDDFLPTAKTAGMMDRFTQSDLAAAQKNPEYGISMISLLRDINNASTAEQQLLATEAANQLRKNYGIYGTGDNSSDYTYASSYGSTIDDLLGKVGSYGSFSYDNQDAYQNLLDSIVNQESFSYDYTTDPSYSAYKKAYLREGDRASANALAQASAASGGKVSSYAMNAAQQAGNYYAGQLADIIPTLEQNAYQKYLDNFSNRLNSLSALQTDREFDYENWMNEYNMLQNSLGNYQSQDTTDYQRYLDAYNQMYQAEQDRLTQEQLQYENKLTEEQLAYQKELDAQSQAQQQYENALALYQALGYATPEVAKILGIKSGSGSTGSSGFSGSGGGGGGGTSSTKSDTKLAETKGGSTGSGSLTVDMNSVLALGYGPISESRLNELVASGEVKEVVKGNKITFEKVEQPSTPASNNSLWNFTQSLMNKTGTSSSNKSGSSTKSGSSAKSSGSSTKSSGSSTKKNTSGSGRNIRAKSILDRELTLY